MSNARFLTSFLPIFHKRVSPDLKGEGKYRGWYLTSSSESLVGDVGAAGDMQVLAELKILSSCPTCYPRAPREPEPAVAGRANLLPGEYLRKAKVMERQYGGVPEDAGGPVERKLASFPPLQSPVFGIWSFHCQVLMSINWCMLWHQHDSSVSKSCRVMVL